MSKKILILILASILLSSCSPMFRLLNVTPSNKLNDVAFENINVNPTYIFEYPDTTGNEYLRKLRKEYGLDTMTVNLKSDLDKIKTVLNWTHNLWTHSGSNTPTKSDPITILEEAKAGKNFRCVEYGIISAAGLNSIGIPSRVLALKTSDAAKIKFGAGHVVAETYSEELGKWIFIDGQYNAIPMLNKIPLNAVEFQHAITNDIDKLKIVNIDGEMSTEKKEHYIKWIGKYLFYLNTKFDHRYVASEERKKVNGKSNLMLVPLNADNLTVFQRKFEIDYCLYTNNINDFYQKPN